MGFPSVLSTAKCEDKADVQRQEKWDEGPEATEVGAETQ